MKKTTDEEKTNDEVPLHLKTIKFVFGGLVVNRWAALMVSFGLVAVGYAADVYYQKIFFLTAMSSVVTFIGLILTIKNHYLKNLNRVSNIAEGYDGGECQCSAPVDEMIQDPSYRNDVLHRATDEGLGLVIILAGTLLNAFGSFIPLINLQTLYP
ncbi:MAG: hypothetical protein ACRCWB_04345 [Enterovibrio sp.]